MAANRSPLLMPSAPSHAAAWCGNGPDPCWVEGKSSIFFVRTASTSLPLQSCGLSLVSWENSRPPMNRAEGTGAPSALTLTSVSLAGSSATVLPPTAIDTTQVPVETTQKGGASDRRCGSSEALESCRPQKTGVC